jgi:hypothetical protein
VRTCRVANVSHRANGTWVVHLEGKNGEDLGWFEFDKDGTYEVQKS